MQLHRKLILSVLTIFVLAGCSSNSEATKTTQGSRDNTPTILVPGNDGLVTIGNDTITFDLSHYDQGYTIVTYRGSNAKVKVRIQNPQSGELYTYDIHDGQNVFPLTGGNGTYTFTAYENISGTKYSQLYNGTYDIQIENDYITYLYPNQYVNYNKDTKAIETAQDLAKSADDDLDVVSSVYEYVIDTISYDDDKAQKAKDGQMSGYLPDVDTILKEKKGICFDYAAVMATMLRTQNIPTRMEIGYALIDDEAVYHAWISVYIQDVGWIDDLIQFDGKNWSMMDPTLISDSNNSASMRDVVKNKNNYTTKYLY